MTTERRAGGASLVAAGILVSRVLGFARDAVMAHVLGTSSEGGALRAALRIPNLLQNLFGEGALSASFIPVYARLRADGRERDAVALAGTVLGLLAVASSLVTLLGLAVADPLVALLTPGFSASQRALTTTLVRIMFPGVGLLVLSAWALGVLNSHRRFVLAYVSPALWNVAIIAAVTVGHGDGLADAAIRFAWGALAGSLLQLGVQLPTVVRLARGVRPALRVASDEARTVLRNFVPAVGSRGVLQVSAFVDLQFATMVSAGAVAALGLAQSITLLPVSLFGMAITAAELPTMSAVGGDEAARHAALRERLAVSARRVAFFVVPSAAAFLLLGDAIAAALYRSGRFTGTDARWLWGILAGASVGLLASTLSRLYSSAFFAVQDTKTPLRCALVRVGVGMLLGWVGALHLPGWLGLEARWGAAGLTLAAGVSGWVELLLLRRALRARLGALPSLGGAVLRLWGLALVAAGSALLVQRLWLGDVAPTRWQALVPLVLFGISYGVLALLANEPDATALLARLRRAPGPAR